MSNQRSNKSRSNTRIAVETLKKLILKNELVAGSNHLEGELAERLGMSRTPIREATLVLEGQGLLEVIPRRGVKILPISTDDMVEIYQVLTVLEGLAVELAAKSDLPDHMFDDAEQAIVDMDKALESDDREAWAVADENFHNELARLSGNSRIVSNVALYYDQVRRARAVTLYLRPSPVKSNEDHRKVLKAIRNGDGDKARQIHTDHRVQSRELLVGLLKKFGLHLV